MAEEERKGGQTSAEALAAVEQIMDLEGMTRDCLQRLDDLERVVALERKKVELEEGMEEKAGVAAADPIAPAPVGGAASLTSTRRSRRSRLRRSSVKRGTR